MTDQLYSRGPDSSGVWSDEACCLGIGHRRLAVIDLSPAGSQPMVSRSGRSVIVYNGEIYNFNELRSDLESEGVRFRGHSDTEVLLEACEYWGLEKTLKCLIGMFAFAFWNRDRRELILVRDRLGIKPLYWGWQGNTLFFGSQCKSFTPHPEWHPEVNRRALANMLRFSYIQSPDCIYSGIQQLRPGHWLKIRGKDRIQSGCYWNLADIAVKGINNRTSLDRKDLTLHLRELLRDSISRRMISDVPIGAFLSGGVDSSLVVSLMQDVNAKPVHTFSIGFHEQDYNEADHAGKVAAHIGTEHTEFYVRPRDVLDMIPGLQEQYDEPFADSSQLPTLLLSELTRKSVTVALSGDGGDEVFAGYNRYLISGALENIFRLSPLRARKVISGMLNRVPTGIFRTLLSITPWHGSVNMDSGKIQRLANVLRLNDYEQASMMLVLSQWPYDVELVPGEGIGGDVLNGERIPDGIEDVVERQQFIDQMSYLPGDILTKVDRASMAHGLELRVPILDHRIVEYAWSLKHSDKIRNGVTKACLRDILYQYVPKEIIERPKMGFGIPIGLWLRGPLREWAEDLLSERKLSENNLFNVPLVRRIWQEHINEVANWQYALWNVLVAQTWYSRWVSG